AVDGDAFIQRLGGTHGAAGGKAEFARGFLLQRRGGERWRRVALALFLVDMGDRKLAVRGLFQRCQCCVGTRLIMNRELLDLVTVKALQTRSERLTVLAGLRFDLPVFARYE